MAGFSKDELAALHEEFQHHQDKIEQYYSLLYKVKGDPNEQAQEREQSMQFYLNVLCKETCVTKGVNC